MKILQRACLISLLPIAMSHAAPCPSGSFEVAPYVGVDAHWTKHSINGSNAKPRAIKPYAYLGLMVAPKLGIELGMNIKGHKAVATENSTGDMSLMQAILHPSRAALKKIQFTRKIDLRAVGNMPIDERTDFLVGAGVSHLKLKATQGNLRVAHQKLAPNFLVGLQTSFNENLKLRGSMTYTPAIGLQASGLKAKAHLGAHLGLQYLFQ